MGFGGVVEVPGKVMAEAREGRAMFIAWILGHFGVSTRVTEQCVYVRAA